MKDEEKSEGSGRRDLAVRTKQYALRSINVFSALPRKPEARVLGKQFLRAATSVGAHYREARRAKSDADFISKVEGALQELDEAAYWLELLSEGEVFPSKRLAPLLIETDELIAILDTVVKKAKGYSNGEDRWEDKT